MLILCHTAHAQVISDATTNTIVNSIGDHFTAQEIMNPDFNLLGLSMGYSVFSTPEQSDRSSTDKFDHKLGTINNSDYLNTCGVTNHRTNFSIISN
ncbi:hypothetical protein VB713_12810 [Anabaena cylindrica UHCC 0172]|uniref:hypothetical protein n=1 Tax=Anabaena cylindrica TaxID=1165 RepID=UPI002B21BD02|nr:hypothetical protein [Anabaena cylindrica]MEA5551827.1 hypothetical protein [Anabaena cylindrica UHCC 0172]